MRFRLAALLGALVMLSTVLVGCAPDVRADGVIHVPAEVKTLVEAEQEAEPGDLILIAPGTYHEQLQIQTPDITVRGEDRNTVIIDGEGQRPFGIVAIADGVRVENLTVTDATFYGVLFTGLHDESGPSAPTVNGYERWDPEQFPPLQRFLVDHVTAINNGLYGIYAFNSQNGAIVDSYASGSADSGLYVGQCRDCGILVQGNVAERSAVGFENANASDSVYVLGNRFTGNRIGLTLLSNYQEAFVPQARNIVAGNLIADNTEPDSPAHVDGGFGIGIGISGGIENRIQNNLIAGNPQAGVLFAHAEDLPAANNALLGNAFAGNRVDIANISAQRAMAWGNCLTSDATYTTEPAALAAALTRADCGTTLAQGDPQPAATEVGGPAAPPGVSFRKVAQPKDQPNLPQRDSYPRLPDAVALPAVDGFAVPGRDLLADRAGVR